MSKQREKLLFDKQAEALVAARSIVDEAEKSGEPVLEGEKEHEYQKAVADMQQYRDALSQEKKLSEQEALVAEQRDAYADASPEEQKIQDTFSEQLYHAIVADDGKTLRTDNVAWTLEPPTSIQRNTVGGYEYRAAVPYVTAGTTTGAQYAVPTIIPNQIEALATKYSGILQMNPNVIVTEGVNPLAIPTVTTAPVGYETAENSEDSSGSYAVLTPLTLKGYRVSAFSNITEEDIASSAPDMMAFIQTQLVQAIANKIALELALGAGTTHPTGMFLASTLTVGATAASVSSYTADDVLTAFGSISAEYWSDLVCTMSQSAYIVALKLKDDVGDYLLLPSLRDGTPDRIIGKPLSIEAQGPAMTTGKIVVAWWSPSHFHVRYGMGGRTFMDVSTDYQFTLFNRYIRIARWLDCNQGIAAAAASIALH